MRLAQAVKNGLFTMDEAGKFEFVIHAGTMEEMRQFLTENWKDAILNESIDGKARDYKSSVGGKL